MIKRFVSFLLIAFAAVAFLVPAAAAATNVISDPNNPEAVCKKINAGQSTVCQAKGDTNPLVGPNGVLVRAGRLIAIVGGIMAIIVILIGSFIFIINGDDPGQRKTARSAIIGALVGLVIIALSQGIIAFIVNSVL